MSSFGKNIRDLRVKAGVTLRDFSTKMEVDSGNWSKIERDLANPPKDDNFFSRLGSVLRIDQTMISELKSLAKSFRISPKEISDKQLLQHLPVMFRRADGEEPTDKEIEHLVDWLRRTVNNEYDPKD